MSVINASLVFRIEKQRKKISQRKMEDIYLFADVKEPDPLNYVSIILKGNCMIINEKIV